MREILVDLDVYSEIWTRRMQGETTENEVLRRILLCEAPPSAAEMPASAAQLDGMLLEEKSSNSKGEGDYDMRLGKIRWVDDVQIALKSLGGRASLLQIYNTVRQNRRAGGRSIPRTLEAIIRRTLEDHSSDSANFKSDDLFALLARGEWGLR